MHIGTMFLFVSPILVPIWILLDSKKKLGSYSWGLAALVAFALGALVRQTAIELELGNITEHGAFEVVIWGKVIAAYFISVAAYKIVASIILRNRHRIGEHRKGNDSAP